MKKQGALLLSLFCFAAAALAVIFVHLINIPAHSRAAQVIENGLHAPGFGIVAVVSYVVLRRSFAAGPALLLTAAFSIGLAFVSEFAQYFGARDASVGDLVADLLGIAGFLALALLVDRDVRRYLSTASSVLLGLFGALAFTASVHPVLYGASILFNRSQALPSIASFDSDWERDIFRPLNYAPMQVINSSDDWPVVGGKLVSVDLHGIEYAGLIVDAYPDWRGYAALEFVAAVRGVPELRAEIRIHDARHNDNWDDRYNGDVYLTSLPRRFEVPLEDIRNGASREIDMARLVKIVIYARNAPPGAQLLVDNFRLVEQRDESAVRVENRRRPDL